MQKREIVKIAQQISNAPRETGASRTRSAVQVILVLEAQPTVKGHEPCEADRIVAKGKVLVQNCLGLYLLLFVK